MRRTSAILRAFACFSISLSGCTGGDGPPANPNSEPEVPTLTKVTFDIQLLNDDGLIGHSVKMYSTSPGRIDRSFAE